MLLCPAVSLSFQRPAQTLLRRSTGGDTFRRTVSASSRLTAPTKLSSRGVFALPCRNYALSTYQWPSLPSKSPHRLTQPFGFLYPNNPFSSQLGAISYFSSSSSSIGGGKRPPTKGNRLAQGAGLVGAASLLFGKTKYVLAALKLTKLSSLGSMVFTIGTYSMFFGLPYAVGIVGLTLVHESGHALVMRQLGIPFSPMVFMPFMGAVIAMNKNPRDCWDEALVAFGGPVLGTAGAVAVAAGAQMTGSQLLYAVADFGFMVNLFNMLPVGMMDGGRIANALSPYAGLAGLGVGGVVAYSGVVQNPLFYLIFLAGGYSSFMRWYKPHEIPKNYYNITNTQRFILTSGYFGLIAFLLVAMNINHQNQKPPEQLMRERQEMTFDMR